MRILVDAFGGDNAPLEIVRGAVLAAEEYSHKVILVGREGEIVDVAKKDGLSLDKIDIIHAEDVIGMEVEPKKILKEYSNSSMAEGLRRLAADEGDAFISAGSTGALLMGSTFLVKRIKGVSRPALAPLIPGAKGPFMLVDSGANVDCRAEMLLQFAHMGSIYMSFLLGGKQPTVGLLNVGTEDSKGGALQHETFALLKESGLNFIGNVEARDVPANIADVVVADGFSGNILLKTLEGTADMLLKSLKESLMATARGKIGAAIAKPAFAALKNKMRTDEYGGAPLLGIRKPVLKTHGNSKALSIKSTIKIAGEFAQNDVIGKIEKSVAKEAE